MTYQPIFPVIKGKPRTVIAWPLYLDEPLAELVGMLIHNGKVTRDENAIQIRNTSKYIFFEENLVRLLGHLNLELNVKSREWAGLFQQQAPRISSAEFTRTFLDMLESTRLDQLLGIEKIPDIVKNSPLTVQKAFLDGYLSTCPRKIVEVGNQLKVQVIPYIKEFVIELSKMLKSFDIDCTLQDTFFYTDFGIDLDT